MHRRRGRSGVSSVGSQCDQLQLTQFAQSHASGGARGSIPFRAKPRAPPPLAARRRGESSVSLPENVSTKCQRQKGGGNQKLAKIANRLRVTSSGDVVRQTRAARLSEPGETNAVLKVLCCQTSRLDLSRVLSLQFE